MAQDLRAFAHKRHVRDTPTGVSPRLCRVKKGAGRELGYLFVVTYGRSGSTLMQSVLNSIPGYLIRGENRGALRHLYEFHHAVQKERRRQRRQRKRQGLPPTGLTARHAFFGIDVFPLRTSIAGIRRLALTTLLRPEPDTRVTGFKEIRWAEEDVADYVEWLQKVFPGARFVFNTRNLDSVSKSKWWAKDPGSKAYLQGVEARLMELRDSLGEKAYHVHYDDYAADPSRLKGLFEWLGEEYDEDRIRKVFDIQYST